MGGVVLYVTEYEALGGFLRETSVDFLMDCATCEAVETTDDRCNCYPERLLTPLRARRRRTAVTMLLRNTNDFGHNMLLCLAMLQRGHPLFSLHSVDKCSALRQHGQIFHLLTLSSRWCNG